MQVVVASRSGPFRRGDERCAPLGIERPRQGRLLDPCEPGAVQLAEARRADLSQQSDHEIASADLHGEPGAGEQTAAAARGLAELSRASQRRDRDRTRAPASCP